MLLSDTENVYGGALVALCVGATVSVCGPAANVQLPVQGWFVTENETEGWESMVCVVGG